MDRVEFDRRAWRQAVDDHEHISRAHVAAGVRRQLRRPAAIVNRSAEAAVGGGGPVAPVAEFTGAPTSGEFPLLVNFTDQSSGTPTSWSWTFGDGGTSTAQNPSYTYNAVGTYTVTLTVTDDSGVVNWHPSPTMHIPHNCVITVVGPYESVQHLQADHGIIDPHARVKHGVTGAESAT